MTDTNPLDEILSMDEQVDALTDAQVKDAWVRGQFAHQLYKVRLSEEDMDYCELALEEHTNSALKQVAIVLAGRHHELAQALGWENGPGNIETLWARWTKDDIPEADKLEVARQNLKNALHGCGMPRINTMRARVRYFSEFPDASE